MDKANTFVNIFTHSAESSFVDSDTYISLWCLFDSYVTWLLDIDEKLNLGWETGRYGMD